MQAVLKNKVKDLRLEMGLTQEDLADKASVTRQTIISIEKGVYAPSVTLAILICKALKKNVEEVFSVSKK
jgi:DNA-binding XRE family transcriptional regulator